jgi:hypothetical protein
MAHPECKYCDGGFHPVKIDEELVCSHCKAPWEPVMVEDDDEGIILTDDDEDDNEDDECVCCEEFEDESELPEDWELEEDFVEDQVDPDDIELDEEFEEDQDALDVADPEGLEHESEIPVPFVPEEGTHPDK